jgi:purine-binding chemotaxis protein CheW
VSEAPKIETGDAARHWALLDERSASLAKRGRAQAGVATRPVLLCLCGGDRYGLPLGEVAQVIPARTCTPVPGTPEAVLGLVALSGRVVSVIGLAAAMGRSDPGGEPPGHFVVLRGGAPVALAVGRVEGIVPVPVAAPADPGSSRDPRDQPRLGSEAVSVYAAAGPQGGAVVIIDPRRLLRRYLP